MKFSEQFSADTLSSKKINAHNLKPWKLKISSPCSKINGKHSRLRNKHPATLQATPSRKTCSRPTPLHTHMHITQIHTCDVTLYTSGHDPATHRRHLDDSSSAKEHITCELRPTAALAPEPSLSQSLFLSHSCSGGGGSSRAAAAAATRKWQPRACIRVCVPRARAAARKNGGWAAAAALLFLLVGRRLRFPFKSVCVFLFPCPIKM